jgi:tRNA threonylcarbamoyladenosine biosynthesis protein TsaE
MAILDKWTIDFVSSSVEQTLRLGVRLGELLQPGDLLCLSGELGAGKTVMARGVGRGWGTAVRITSPTLQSPANGRNNGSPGTV